MNRVGRTAAAAGASALAALASCGGDDAKPGAASAGQAPSSPVAPTSPAKPPATSLGGTAMLKIGDPAPAFRAKDNTGKERTLAEFKGKRVVLWFFPKADTPD